MRVAKLSTAVVIVGTMLLAGASVRAAPVTVNFGSTGDNFMYAGVRPSIDFRERNWGTSPDILAGPNTTTNGPPYRGLLHTDISSLASVPNLSVQSGTLTEGSVEISAGAQIRWKRPGSCSRI